MVAQANETTFEKFPHYWLKSFAQRKTIYFHTVEQTSVSWLFGTLSVLRKELGLLVNILISKLSKKTD